DQRLLAGLAWRSIGPNRGGRSIACAGSPGRPNEYYFGATGGGLWKTTDGGATWLPVTDGQIKSSSVGAVAVSESNPDVVYLGMGETQLRGNVMQGDGVYRSADAGKTWTHLGLSDTQAIGRIRVHPSSPDLVYVAALGHPYGPSAERGVYRSADGGRHWTRILFRNDRSGAVDIDVDANDPRVLYASLWEVYRTPWMLSSGGPGSGLFKSTDGGDSWTEITRNKGLPKGLLGKITVTVSRADSRRVYAMVEAEDGGLFRSDDAGATWAMVNDERDLRQRAFYFSRIVADPKDADTVYALNFRLSRSTDGGRTFVTLPESHADHHDLWIDPTNPQRLINSNDGGGTISVNRGRTWSAQDYPTAQMYHVGTTADFPFHVCGAQQDNSTACVPSDDGLHLRDPRDSAGRWLYAAGGNESGYVVPHPVDPNIFYAGGQEAYLTRYDRRNGQARDIQPFPRLYSGESAGSVPERWNWTFPIAVSRVDPGVVYAGSQHLWRTANEGQSWERISPDLTRADPKTLGDSGGPITKDQNGPEFFATIFTIAPSRSEKGTLFVGSDDGRVHVTRDGGKTWADVTPPDMPDFTTISLIEASPHAPGAAYVAGKRYRLDDRAPYAWRTQDYGRTWVRIVRGIAPGDYVHAIREDTKRAGLLFAGTEHGIHVSFDNGGQWQSLSLNLPDTQVSDLVVQDQDLVIATHGRSFYVLDGIECLRQFTPDVANASVHLFVPGPAYRRARAANIDLFLKSGATSAVLEIFDGTGRSVRRFAGDALKTPGLNRVRWDLRYRGATTFPGLILRSANPGRGPLAPPGAYRVRLTVDGQSHEQTLTVLKDPRLLDVSDADLQAQYELARQVSDRTGDANQAVVRIRALRTQIADRLGANPPPALTTPADTLIRKLSDIEEAIYQVKNRSPKDPLNFPIKLNNRIAALQDVIEAADARPTQQAYDVFKELSAELQGHLSRLEQVLVTDVAVFNRSLAQMGREPVALR
ncbi:MAG: glycosyl hydrolase, partial [Acidobacteria bacterium]|nr:glycosyl hydrolase [Acidobacteriota bacterium]